VRVRLVRLAQQPSRIADDIRAALASLSRGDTVAGGIALIGVRPLPTGRAVDAIIVLPRGLLIVLGVDLPEPVMRLEAPLTGPWKADGWALATADKTVNPAAGKLALAESITKGLRPKVPETLPIGTILAVGPFVDTVDQPPADVSGSVRVVFPTATSMLAATVSLASAPKPCSAQDARALIKILAPDAPEVTDEMLAAEGFGAVEEGVVAEKDDPLAAITVQLPQVPPPPTPIEVTTPVPRITAATPIRPHAAEKAPRWLPLGAIGLLAVLLITAIVLAATSGGSSTPTTTAAAAPPPQIVNGITLLERASGTDTQCAAHAIGDVQASLQHSACLTMRRASFEAAVDGRPAAVSVALLTFPDAVTAAAFKAVADTPGGGGMADLADETAKWPHTPHFDGAAYLSTADGTTVRLVLAAWFDQPSTTNDPALLRAARAGSTAQLT
jgi:hypothetical protein